MKKALPVIASIILIAAALAVGGTLYLDYENRVQEEQEALKDQMRAVGDDLWYARIFRLEGNVEDMTSAISDLMSDNNLYDRVEFYEESPPGFDEDAVHDGVIILFPSEATAGCVERLKTVFRWEEIDIADYGFTSEITVSDVINRKDELYDLCASMESYDRDYISHG